MLKYSIGLERCEIFSYPGNSFTAIPVRTEGNLSAR